MTEPAKLRPLSDRELHDYLAACKDATDEELLDVKAADGVSLRDILDEANSSTTITVENVAPETMALMTGLHPAHFDAEGHELVQKIIDKKAAQ